MYFSLSWVCAEALWQEIRSHSKKYLHISRVNGSWLGNVHHPLAEMAGLQDAGWDGNKNELWIFWAPIFKKSLL